MRDIKRRRSSIQSTGQITRAMKLVATVKLQKAREKAEHTRPYSDGVYQTMQSILERLPGSAIRICRAGITRARQ